MEIKGGLAGMFAFAYAPAVHRDDIESFQKSNKFPVDRKSFRIFPKTDARLAAPFFFIAPESAALNAAIGFDLLSETARRDATNRAILSLKFF